MKCVSKMRFDCDRKKQNRPRLYGHKVRVTGLQVSTPVTSYHYQD